jgi:hypothetical protein
MAKVGGVSNSSHTEAMAGSEASCVHTPPRDHCEAQESRGKLMALNTIKQGSLNPDINREPERKCHAGLGVQAAALLPTESGPVTRMGRGIAVGDSGD